VLRAWLALALWTWLVWKFSSDAFSAASTSRFLVPLLDWLFPDLGREAFRLAHFLVRKSAHLVIYAVLGGLTLRAFRATWQLSGAAQVLAAAALVVGVASADEVNQKTSAVRRGSPVDVGIDTAGGATGIALALLLARRRERVARLPQVAESADPPAFG
jgi:VanZ family protein